MENVRSMLHGFLPFSLVPVTKLTSLWFGLKDLFTLHKLAEKLVLDHETNDVASGRRDVDPHGGYGRLRDKWANSIIVKLNRF